MVELKSKGLGIRQGPETRKPDSMAGLQVGCLAVTAIHPDIKTESFRAEKHFQKLSSMPIMHTQLAAALIHKQVDTH